MKVKIGSTELECSLDTTIDELKKAYMATSEKDFSDVEIKVTHNHRYQGGLSRSFLMDYKTVAYYGITEKCRLNTEIYPIEKGLCAPIKIEVWDLQGRCTKIDCKQSTTVLEIKQIMQKGKEHHLTSNA